MLRLLIGAGLALVSGPAIAPGALACRSECPPALERIARIDPQLHSVIAVDPTAIDQARRVDASGLRGPLAGQPVLIKDNIESAGPLPTTAGSLALTNNVTNRDAPLVARLRAAGAVIVGKTNLSEWANIRSTHSISGWSAVGGRRIIPGRSTATRAAAPAAAARRSPPGWFGWRSGPRPTAR